MEPNEFRLGNYVKMDGIEGLWKVHNINESIGKDYSPIPLTQQWLLDFGFEFNMEDEAYQGKRLHIEVRNNDECLTKKNKELLKDSFGVWLFCTNSFLCEIKYVHQLQNLYFAITGKELIKKSN